MAKDGTASATQVGEALREIINAVTTVIEDFEIKALTKAIRGNGKRFAGMIYLLFTALETGQNLVLQSQDQFKVWFELQVGGYSDGKGILEDLRSLDSLSMNQSVSEQLLSAEGFPVSLSPKTVKLAKVTPFELGFRRPTTVSELYQRAERRGLCCCLAEIGPELALQKQEQGEKSSWRIGMNPIRYSPSCPVYFRIDKFFSRSFQGTSFTWDLITDIDDEWIFVIPD